MTADMRALIEASRENVVRAICAEQCAFYGEPPCWQIVAPEAWDKDDCGEPGCRDLAAAALAALRAKLAEGE
jgi:hypothetical protein